MELMVNKVHGIAALATAVGVAAAPTFAWIIGATPSPTEFDAKDLPMNLVAMAVLFKVAMDSVKGFMEMRMRREAKRNGGTVNPEGKAFLAQQLVVVAGW
jgi:hypothetical protein